MRMYVKDPKNGKDSVTLTAFVVGFIVCLAKLALSGMLIGEIQFTLFSGVDFAAAVGALGAIYGFRRMNDYKRDDATPAPQSNVVSGFDNRPPVEGPGD